MYERLGEEGLSVGPLPPPSPPSPPPCVRHSQLPLGLSYSYFYYFLINLYSVVHLSLLSYSYYDKLLSSIFSRALSSTTILLWDTSSNPSCTIPLITSRIKSGQRQGVTLPDTHSTPPGGWTHRANQQHTDTIRLYEKDNQRN